VIKPLSQVKTDNLFHFSGTLLMIRMRSAMTTSGDMRKVPRKNVDRPTLALISFQKDDDHTNLFINVLNYSVQGVLIKSQLNFEKGFELKLMIQNYELGQWDSFFCRVAWRQEEPSYEGYHIGLEFLFPVESSGNQTKKIHNGLAPADLEFILNTRLLNILPKDGACAFLNCMTQKTVDPDVKFISQGDQGDALYIIQKGLCSIQIEDRNNNLIDVAHHREGDVIGEMALLTGEVRSASVISLSSMILWELSRYSFDEVCAREPEIREFLTELLTSRLENSTATGVRNVGKYLMTHQIGIGGWSFVYKGKHKLLNMPVAIKMMKHNQAMDEQFLDNFRKEGEIIGQLNHPNIVQVYDIEELYRTIFIIMEYLDGESLEDLLNRKKRLPFSRILSFLTQIAAGLAYAHDQNIVHRDIKPANVFVQKDDQVKLLDFGLACESGKIDIDQTGTVHYMAPEQIEGDPVDHRSDVYSFGILAYEMITGQKPFSSDNLMDVMNMHKKTAIPDPQHLVPDLPDLISDLIFKACAKAPSLRFDSMHEVVELLLELNNELDGIGNASPNREKEVTVLLISHEKKHHLELNRLLDAFSREAQEKGITIHIAGNTQIE
jgi:serine/threonine protein kinase